MRTRSLGYKEAAIGSSVMFEKLVVIQLGALLFANTHDHGTEWVKWGGIVAVSYTHLTLPTRS